MKETKPPYCIQPLYVARGPTNINKSVISFWVATQEIACEWFYDTLPDMVGSWPTERVSKCCRTGVFVVSYQTVLPPVVQAFGKSSAPSTVPGPESDRIGFPPHAHGPRLQQGA